MQSLLLNWFFVEFFCFASFVIFYFLFLECSNAEIGSELFIINSLFKLVCQFKCDKSFFLLINDILHLSRQPDRSNNFSRFNSAPRKTARARESHFAGQRAGARALGRQGGVFD